MNDPEDVSITYSVRELLADIKTQLVEIKTILSGKANQGDVDALDRRVLRLERITWAAGGVTVVAGALLWLHQIGVLKL